MKVNYEELWEPWHLEGDEEFRAYRSEEDWPIPSELVDRFRRVKAEMEAVWQELHDLEPGR